MRSGRDEERLSHLLTRAQSRPTRACSIYLFIGPPRAAARSSQYDQGPGGELEQLVALTTWRLCARVGVCVSGGGGGGGACQRVS